MSDPILEIKAKADIVDLISEIIPVKRSGTGHVAVCPFHNDTRPSMQISKSKGIFKCFSCGAGGDVFKFWSEYYQKDFKETLKDLAQKYDVELKEYSVNKEEVKIQNTAIEMHKIAAEFYYDQLLRSPSAQICRDYLSERGFDSEVIKKFQLGFSPADENDWALLIARIKSKIPEVTEQQIMDSGLALHSQKSGKFYDRFRGRLMVPVCDERSRVIAFGARTIPNSPEAKRNPAYAQAKYINSPESTVYTKGNNLYGLDSAKESIRKQDSVIVVEGYFDVISLVQAGFQNVVANQGTALTPRQAKLLSKFSDSKRIYLCFDTDKAGEAATEKAFEVIQASHTGMKTELKVIRVPGDKDPDDYIQAHGKDAFTELINKAPFFLDYKISQVCSKTDMGSPQSKAKAISDLSKFIYLVSNKIERKEYQKIIAEKLKIDENILVSQLDAEFANVDTQVYDSMRPQQVKPKQSSTNSLQKAQAGARRRFIYSPYIDLICMCLKNKSFLEKFMQESEELSIETEYQNIIDAMVDVSFENPDLQEIDKKLSLINSKLLDAGQASTLIASVANKFDLEEEFLDFNDESYNELLAKLKISTYQKQIEDLKMKMRDINDDSDEWFELEKEKLRIERTIQSIKSKKSLA